MSFYIKGCDVAMNCIDNYEWATVPEGVTVAESRILDPETRKELQDLGESLNNWDKEYKSEAQNLFEGLNRKNELTDMATEGVKKVLKEWEDQILRKYGYKPEELENQNKLDMNTQKVFEIVIIETVNSTSEVQEPLVTDLLVGTCEKKVRDYAVVKYQSEISGKDYKVIIREFKA